MSHRIALKILVLLITSVFGLNQDEKMIAQMDTLHCQQKELENSV